MKYLTPTAGSIAEAGLSIAAVAAAAGVDVRQIITRDGLSRQEIQRVEQARDAMRVQRQPHPARKDDKFAAAMTYAKKFDQEIESQRALADARRDGELAKAERERRRVLGYRF